MGNSGVAAPEAHESRFVADEAPGVLDVEYMVPSSGERLTVNIETTRYVGALNSGGFLAHANQHIAQGTLAEFLVLTIRARIKSFEVGGILGRGLLDVAVFLNEEPLGALVGEFGPDSDDWQEFVLDASDATAGLSFGFALARFRSDGGPDGDFGDDGVVRTIFSTQDDFGLGLALYADDRIVVVGESSNQLNSDFAVARYETDGTPDSNFGDGGKLTVDFFGGFDRADCVAIQSDGKILVAGSARNVTTTVLGLVRLLG